MVKINSSEEFNSCTPEVSNVAVHNVNLPGTSHNINLQYESLGDGTYRIHSTTHAGAFLGSVMANAIHIGNVLKLIEDDNDRANNYKLDHYMYKGCNTDKLYMHLVDPNTMISSRHIVGGNLPTMNGYIFWGTKGRSDKQTWQLAFPPGDPTPPQQAYSLMLKKDNTIEIAKYDNTSSEEDSFKITFNFIHNNGKLYIQLLDKNDESKSLGYLNLTTPTGNNIKLSEFTNSSIFIEDFDTTPTFSMHSMIGTTPDSQEWELGQKPDGSVVGPTWYPIPNLQSPIDLPEENYLYWYPSDGDNGYSWKYSMTIPTDTKYYMQFDPTLSPTKSVSIKQYSPNPAYSKFNINFTSKDPHISPVINGTDQRGAIYSCDKTFFCNDQKDWKQSIIFRYAPETNTPGKCSAEQDQTKRKYVLRAL